MKPAVVILAAGASARLGECKALASLGGKSALEHLIEQSSMAGAKEILVVSGAHHELIEGELRRIPCGSSARLVLNPRWAEGRSGSVAAAVAQLEGRDLLLAPIDVPLVGAAVFRILFEAWSAAGSPPGGWLAPALEPGPRHGHPVVLGAELAAEAAKLNPGCPLRELRQRARPLWGVSVLDPAILDDLDCPEDLARLRFRMAKGRGPPG